MSEAPLALQSLLGLALMPLLAWLLSENRANRPSWRWMATALALQLIIAGLVLKTPLLWQGLLAANAALASLEAATLKGSSYLFGYLGGAPLPFALKQGVAPPVVLAFQILPLVIVTSALAALLWHWRVLPALIRVLSWCLQRSLGISGPVGLNAGANIFLGVVEAPLVIKGALAHMSRAELFTIMTMGMSTVSGVVLVLYSQTIASVVENAFGHILTASLISLPATFLLCRLMVPETASTLPPAPHAAVPEAGSEAKTQAGTLRYASTMDAIIQGTMDGLQLFLAIIAVLLVVFALVALSDNILALLPDVAGAPLTLQRIFGWLFAPLMWLTGIAWNEALEAGSLMGVKAILNEYVAYQQLAALPQAHLSERTRHILVYALCGFANLASIGLLISTIGTLAPSRRSEAAELGFKSWFVGNLATLMTGCIIGIVRIF
jgi:concentrative nucleoside transporter, CNT family